jgi:Flp pilus assembly protein TadG
VGRKIDQHDGLGALELTTMPRRSFRTSISGQVAVEFALILPALAMVIVGTLYAGLLMYSVSGLHSAVTAGARCFSVNSTQCGTTSAAQTYAQRQYYGVNSPTFTAVLATCGHEVSGTVTMTLDIGMASWNIPISATSCFP